MSSVFGTVRLENTQALHTFVSSRLTQNYFKLMWSNALNSILLFCNVHIMLLVDLYQ